jgi:hypothetical protein
MTREDDRIPLSLEGIRVALEQSESPQARQHYLASLRQRVAEYERQYELRSVCLREALDAGRLEENLEIVKWLHDYEALTCLEHRGRAQ